MFHIGFTKDTVHGTIADYTCRCMIIVQSKSCILGICVYNKIFIVHIYTVELQWLKHLWNHEIMFETGVV